MQSRDSGLDTKFLAKGSLMKTMLVFFTSKPWTKSDVLRGRSATLKIRNQVCPLCEPSSCVASFCSFNLKISVLMDLPHSVRAFADPNFL